MWGLGLVLPQLNVSDFVDFTWEPSPIERSGWGWAGGEAEVGSRRRGGEPWMKSKIELKNKLK